jgi:sortase A
VLDEAPRSLTVDDTATWVLDPVPGEPDREPTRALITLTTCQDLFRSADRSVGFGHLQSTRNKQG